MNTTTTLDPPTSLLVTIRKDGPGYLVDDHLGTRYGYANHPVLAVIAWWSQVQDLLDLDEPTADPLASEIRRYKQALT